MNPEQLSQKDFLDRAQLEAIQLERLQTIVAHA